MKVDHKLFDHGKEDGAYYVQELATKGELKRLRDFGQQLRDEPVYNWPWWFSGEGKSEYTDAQLLYFEARADKEKDREASERWWDRLGDDARPDDPDYLEGWLTAVMEA